MNTGVGCEGPSMRMVDCRGLRKTRRRPFVVILSAILAAVVLVACGNGTKAAAAASKPRTLTKVSILMNYFPEAEQGGFWAVDALHLAKRFGLNIDIIPGGDDTNTTTEVGEGAVQFALVSDDSALLAREAHVPVTLVFAAIPHNLQCLMYHPGDHVDSNPASLRGHTVAIEASLPLWQWMVAKYHLQNVKTVGYASIAEWETQPNMVRQCYVTDGPYRARERHIKFGLITLSSLGYNTYGVGMATTAGLIRSNPALVRRVVAAVELGWKDYLRNPIPTNKWLAGHGASASGETLGNMNYVAKEFVEFQGKQPVGPISSIAVKKLYGQLKLAGLIPHAFNYQESYTNEFVTR